MSAARIPPSASTHTAPITLGRRIDLVAGRRQRARSALEHRAHLAGVAIYNAVLGGRGPGVAVPRPGWPSGPGSCCSRRRADRAADRRAGRLHRANRGQVAAAVRRARPGRLGRCALAGRPEHAPGRIDMRPRRQARSSASAATVHDGRLADLAESSALPQGSWLCGAAYPHV